MKSIWIVYVFCSVFIFVGGGVAIYALQGIVKAGAIGSWPPVDAKLTDINLKVRHDSDGDLQEVVVKYEYFVDGNRYTNNKIHPTYSGSNMSGHKELYERLKNCSIVRARYNKENPRESYLVTGRYSQSFVLLFGGLLFFFSGLMFLLIFHFAAEGSSNFVDGLEIVE
jgi:hypothetical protein